MDQDKMLRLLYKSLGEFIEVETTVVPLRYMKGKTNWWYSPSEDIMQACETDFNPNKPIRNIGGLKARDWIKIATTDHALITEYNPLIKKEKI